MSYRQTVALLCTLLLVAGGAWLGSRRARWIPAPEPAGPVPGVYERLGTEDDPPNQRAATITRIVLWPDGRWQDLGEPGEADSRLANDPDPAVWRWRTQAETFWEAFVGDRRVANGLETVGGIDVLPHPPAIPGRVSMNRNWITNADGELMPAPDRRFVMGSGRWMWISPPPP